MLYSKFALFYNDQTLFQCFKYTKLNSTLEVSSTMAHTNKNFGEFF